MSQIFSDEYLNAYLDDELDVKEKRQLLDALRKDEALRARVCQLEQVRKMVSLAYSDVRPRNTSQSRRPRLFSRVVRATIAASLLLTMGALIGWTMHGPGVQAGPSLVSLSKQMRLQQDPVPEAWKVLLHVTSDDPYRVNVLLEETERLLQHAQKESQQVNVEILANGKGLDMLRSDTSQFKTRINELQQQYHNLLFVACGKAIERLEQEKRLRVKLLEDVDVTRSALSRSIKRQKQGWTYIKI